jgi:hypothetical protein
MNITDGKVTATFNKVVSDDYHLPEDDNHHSHRRGNLKSYKVVSIREF